MVMMPAKTLMQMTRTLPTARIFPKMTKTETDLSPLSRMLKMGGLTVTLSNLTMLAKRVF